MNMVCAYPILQNEIDKRPLLLVFILRSIIGMFI